MVSHTWIYLQILKEYCLSMAYEVLRGGESPIRSVRVSEGIATKRAKKVLFYFKEFLNGASLNIAGGFEALNQEREENGYSKKLAYLVRLAGLLMTGSVFLSFVFPWTGAALGPIGLGFPFRELPTLLGFWLVWKGMTKKEINRNLRTR